MSALLVPAVQRMIWGTMLSQQGVRIGPVIRRDVEGLRAVAVLMVLLYHLGLDWIPGGYAGVDVFFVISGFLITGLLIREVESTGTVSLGRFYARRAKRLFPAAGLVLVATVALAICVLPKTRWLETGGDVFAAAAYFINWRLAARSVDYLAEDSLPSFVQHFWSLAVEEQYYLVWPVLLLAGLWALRRWLSYRAIAWLAVLTMALPSLFWSIHLTFRDSSTAYFVTTTRMWELAIGGAVALIGPRWKSLPPIVANMLGWAGLAAIVCAALFVTRQLPWPGYAAALPTLGAAAVIASGFAATNRGSTFVLSMPILVFIGSISYSLYLWHWPLIAAVQASLGELSVPAMFAVAGVSLLLAWLTLVLLENPIRHSPAMTNSRYALSSGMNFSLVAALAGVGLMLLVLHQGNGQAEQPRVAGAAVLAAKPRGDSRGAPVDRVDWFVPDAALATKDLPQYAEDGCVVRTKGSEPLGCYYGDPNGKITIAMVGDSKIAQWLPAMIKIANKNGWRILFESKNACGFHSAMLVAYGGNYVECWDWNRAVLKKLLGPNKPDYVITSQVRSFTRGSRGEDLAPALVDWWRQLESAGIEVIAMADNPHPEGNVYECVAQNSGEMTRCAFPKTELPGGTAALWKAAETMGGIDRVDLNDAICPTDMCAPVIGNVLIYRQGSHITRTYIETLTPRLEKELKRIVVANGKQSN